MPCRQLGLARGLSLIKIRYSDLPAGLHVRAEAVGRSTIIYLLPGLNSTERRAALLRARRSASMGHGPRLPAGSVVAAGARDRVAATARNSAAAFRAHPLLLLPPVLIAVGATLVYVMMSAVSITYPQANPPRSTESAPAGRPGQPGSGPGPAARGRVGGPSAPGSGGPGAPGGGRPGGGHPGAPGSSPSPPRGTSASPRPSAPGSPSAPPSGSGSPAPGPSSSAPADPAPTGGPASPSPAPSPTPTPSSSTCVTVGPVGVCLK
jgi:hypothetical protein